MRFLRSEPASVVRDNVFSYNNFAGNALCRGGGLLLVGTNGLKVEGNRFAYNTAYSGCGLKTSGTTKTNIAKNEFVQNRGEIGGGIEDNSSTETQITRNKFLNNTVTDAGGAIVVAQSNPRLENNLIVGNTAVEGGGIGVFNQSNLLLINNTITRNIAKLRGGGLFNSNSTTSIINTILWADSASAASEIGVDGGTVTATYADIQGGWSGDGVINANPLFADALFHLSNTSPCIGKGTLIDCPKTDLEGLIRPNPPNSKPDLGACENSLGEPTQLTQWSFKVVETSLYMPSTFVADFDGDGDLDLFSINGDALFWTENRRSNWVRHTIDPAFPTHEGTADPVDLDKDGDIDFIINDAVNNGILAWYENKEKGMTWQKHIIASSLNYPTNRVRSIGDMDGDGDLDVVTPTMSDGRVLWFENVAGGTTWTEHVVAVFGSVAVWTTVADMDQDKDLDIVAGRYSAGNMVWYENKLPEANWPAHPVATLPGTVIAECADMDADGDMDLVTHSNQSSVLVWYENPSWTAIEIDRGLSNLMLGQVGDVDGDGDLDVTCSGQNALAWCENLGGAKKWRRNSLDLTFTNTQVTTVFGLGDMDSDKDTDVIATVTNLTKRTGELRWYANPRFTTAVTNNEDFLPQQIALAQNYPNPFNPSTTIEFALPKASFVTLKIYNLLGKEVATLVATKLPAGIHRRVWQANGLASGVYLYRLQAGEFVQTKKLILLR